MEEQLAYTLINSQTQQLAFKIFDFEDDSHFENIQRLNFYSIILILEGSGKIKVDFSEYNFRENALLCFSPYQPFSIASQTQLKGIALNFHPDFFCIHKHNKEVACNGVLFNNIYQQPFQYLDKTETESFSKLIDQLKIEMQYEGLAQYELLISYLKIFLINASRSKIAQYPELEKDLQTVREPVVLEKLKQAIEKHYKTKHSPSDYAEMLNIASKSLAKIAKEHFNKTLTNLISERIVIEAKRELYLSSKPVKAIAYELGFDDEYYFSRFFKSNAGVSPQLYRDTIGFGKG